MIVNKSAKDSQFQFQSFRLFCQKCMYAYAFNRSTNRGGGSPLAPLDFLFVFVFSSLPIDISNCVLLREWVIWDMVVTLTRAQPSCPSAKILHAESGFRHRELCSAQFSLAWMILLSSYVSGKVSAKSRMISQPLGQCLLIVWVVHRSEIHPTAGAWLFFFHECHSRNL